jgi:hypothetical protein
MKAFLCFLAIILSPLVLNAQDNALSTASADTVVTGDISAIDTNKGEIILSENGLPKLKLLPRDVASIVLWTLLTGQKIKVSGNEDTTKTPPSMTVTSLDKLCMLSADGTVVAWPNPIIVEGDPDKGITPMIAFTAAIRESDAKQAHDGLMQRYQERLAAQSARITAILGGHTGLPLDLDYLMPKDAVLQHLKLIDVFRVDSGKPEELAYVVPNPDSNTKNALFVTFDNDKLVRITDMKTDMSKPMLDSYMQKLKDIANQWKTKGATAVFEKDADMYYLYTDNRSYMSISGSALEKKPGLYSVTVEYTEKTYQNKILNQNPAAQITEPDRKGGTLQNMLEQGMRGMNGAVSIRALRDNGKDLYIYMRSFFDPSRRETKDGGSFIPWILFKRNDQTGDYSVYASGDYQEALMSMQDAPAGPKYGMPGSGYPQGTTKKNDIFADLSVRLSANKELGDCVEVPHLHCNLTQKTYDILVSKDSGKWIIVENLPNEEGASYLSRGNESLFLGVPRKLAFGVKPDARPPKLTDNITCFDDYYGLDGQDRSKNQVTDPCRAWLRDNLIIVYGDQRPNSVFVSMQKITGEAFDKNEVFDIANSLSDNATWMPTDDGEDSSQFTSKDNKYVLTWIHKKQVPGSANQPQLIAVQLNLTQPDTLGTPNAPKPMVYDDPHIFENYYGTVQVNDVGWAKIRIWRRGNFVIMHMDARPQRLIIDVSKANKGELSEVEVFDIADRYCGKLKWNSKGQNEKSTVYESDDKKCTLNWFKNDPIDPKDPLSGRDHVTLTYPLRDDTLDKL